MINTVGIVGAGPAGCALACFLAKRGIKCYVFDDNKKPELLVGESLIPAAIPILQKLGIEHEVARISARKEGAALRHFNAQPRVDFEFQKLGENVPHYAYNVPRPQFDAIIRARAESLGAQFVDYHATVLARPSSECEIMLSAESLAAAGLDSDQHPQLLIDATGRNRLFSKLLGIKADRGARNDVAHFAHFENFSSDSKLTGQIVISVLKSGWSWQIPLQDCTSVGVVLDSGVARSYGDTAAERLENVMCDNPVLKKSGYKRTSRVMTYSNYQLLSQQGFGKGWVLLGDAFGFVDPMLSPGVTMSLKSAELLDDLLFAQGDLSAQQYNTRLERYVVEIRQWHAAWTSLIEYFYDGRLLSLGEMRPDAEVKQRWYSFGRIVDSFISRIMVSLVSGVGTRSPFNIKALAMICRVMVRDKEKLDTYAINSERKVDS